MAKDYLNREDREIVGLTVLMHERLKNFMTSNLSHMGANEKKFLKMSLTFYDKFLKSLFERVGEKEGQKIINNFKDCEVIFKPKNFAKPKEDMLELSIDSIHDLAEGIISGHCMDCKKQGPDVDDCNIKDILIYSKVPAVEPYSGCMYRMPKIDYEKQINRVKCERWANK